MIQAIRLLLVLLLLFTSGVDAMDGTVKRTQEYYSLLLMERPNEAPVVDPKVGLIFKWPASSVRLDATVTDHPGDTLVFEWTKLSGPGAVEFKNPVAEDITAEFSQFGVYTLQLSVSDGEFTSTVQVTIQFDFLGRYTNPRQRKLPADRVYPMGQKMMITAWVAKSEFDLQKMADSGFTMQGPMWDTRDLSYIETASNKGLRSAHRLVNGAPAVFQLLPLLDGGDKEAIVYEKIRNQILRITDNPLYDATVDVWLTGTEEISTRMTPETREQLLRYLQNAQRIVTETDPQQRPLWMSDVTGVDAIQMNVTHQYLDMVGPQMYLERIGNGTHYEHNAIINKLAGEVVITADTYSIPATVSFGALYEPIPERDTPEFIDKVVEHDLYLALNKGIQGFQIYSWHNFTDDEEYSDEQTFDDYKTAWYKHIKRFTDHGLDYAFLWGDRRDDLRLKIVSGPERIQWVQNDKSYDFPTISMQNIQYGVERFLILTNSSTEAVQVSVSNFPGSCVKVLDIREGKYLDKTFIISPLLPPLGVRLYRFNQDGEC